MYAHTTGTGNASAGFTITTEYILATVAIPGLFSFLIDRNLMAAGDVLEVYVRQMVLTSGTKREVFRQTYCGVAPTWALIADTPWIANELVDSGALEFCVKQSFGTGRAMPWKLMNANGPQGYQRGVAVAAFVFSMFDTSNALVSGLTFSNKQISKDGGAEAGIAGSITEIGSTGQYKVALTATEMDADEIELRFTATGAIVMPIKIRTVR